MAPIALVGALGDMQDKYERGSLSFLTLLEESGIENPGEEMTRIFEGKTLVNVMDQVVPLMVQMIFQKVQAQLFPAPPTAETVPGMPAPEEGMAPGPGPETGLAAGGGGQGGRGARLPGAGLPPGGPSTTEYGPPVQEGGGEVTVRTQ